MVTVSTQQRNKIHPHKFTLWVAIGSILMMFAGLTSAYIVKSNQANWEEVVMPKAFWASTAAILLSSLTMHLAVRAFRERAFAKYRSLLIVTLVLGIAFMALQYAGFRWLWDHGVQFRGAGEGQFLYVIAGLHGVHVLGGIIALLVVFLRAFFGKSKNYNVVPVEVMATYWHFVDVLWLYLLVFFIWIG
ncbi:MAG: heme-copper oxidase subunit III [Chitinophagaceae bacterium]|nr:MAG: heme-copper oxidase subunit III [Chitinophagaceae bacterium]